MPTFLLTDEDLAGILREKYSGEAGAHRLSQVLTEVFGRARPDGVMVDGPVTIRQPSAVVPALTIEPFPGATVPPFSGGGGGSGGGGLDPADTTFPTPPDPAGLAPSFPVMLYGIVQNGTGNNYSVRCWITNPSTGSPIGDFSCYQGQIDPDEQIPAGTHCLVWCGVAANRTLTGFRMTVPVFLE